MTPIRNVLSQYFYSREDMCSLNCTLGCLTHFGFRRLLHSSNNTALQDAVTMWVENPENIHHQPGSPAAVCTSIGHFWPLVDRGWINSPVTFPKGILGRGISSLFYQNVTCGRNEILYVSFYTTHVFPLLKGESVIFS